MAATRVWAAEMTPAELRQHGGGISRHSYVRPFGVDIIGSARVRRRVGLPIAEPGNHTVTRSSIQNQLRARRLHGTRMGIRAEPFASSTVEHRREIATGSIDDRVSS
jgi:hypothetical protein